MSINFTLPNDFAWGDYLLDGRVVSFTLEVKSSVPKEIVHVNKIEAQKEPDFIPLPKADRPMPRCRRGNACPWNNCKFRHEACTHFKMGRRCRALEADPESNKCPDDGGCRYDHRDPTKLREFVYSMDVETHDELMDKFGPLGLHYVGSEYYDTDEMDRNDRDMLIRSLREGDENEWLRFHHEHPNSFRIHFLPA